jgi:hypothetical protein
MREAIFLPAAARMLWFTPMKKSSRIDESFRSVAPKKVVDSLGPPPRLP